jgi:hypothetical protein
MKTLFCLLFTFSVFVNTSKSQNGFQKIEYASFDVNSYRTNVNDSVIVGLYCSVTSGGLVRINNPDDLQDSPKVYYSFQLSATELEKVNSIFNSTRPLKTYLVKTKLEENSMYAGSYDFYRVSYPKGAVDSICLIMPFVSGQFREINDLLSDIFYSRKGRIKIDHLAMPSDFFTSLKKCYLKSKYLPEIKNPPPFMIENKN